MKTSDDKYLEESSASEFATMTKFQTAVNINVMFSSVFVFRQSLTDS